MKYNAFNPLLITWKYNGVFEAIITMYYVLRACVKMNYMTKIVQGLGEMNWEYTVIKSFKCMWNFILLFEGVPRSLNTKKLNKNVLKRQIN